MQTRLMLRRGGHCSFDTELMVNPNKSVSIYERVSFIWTNNGRRVLLTRPFRITAYLETSRLRETTLSSCQIANAFTDQDWY
jgi:hypothetical protein